MIIAYRATTRPTAGSPPAAAARPRRRRAGRSRCRTTRGSRSRSASSSSAATLDEARERFARPRRACTSAARSRIAYQYLRDAADADEAVQDAFVKVFAHIDVVSRGLAVRGLVHADSHQRLPRSAQGARRAATAGSSPADEASGADEARAGVRRRRRADPEARLLARERRARLAAAVDRLDGRQRTVFMLCHYGDCTPREVSAMTGLNESTVRVHLFRAARKLRALLGGKP